MAVKYDPCDALGLGEPHIKATEDLGTLSFKPKVLMDSESTCSIEIMEKMLLTRLLTRKELKIKSMLQR